MAVYHPAAFRDVFEHHFTYMAHFWRNVHRYASRPALHDPQTGRRWTYAELGADVERVAGGLAAHGVGPGDVVVFQLFNSPEWALLYLAAQHLGAIGSPINFRFSAGETAFVLDDSKPVVYVYDASLAEVAATALDLATHQPDATFVADGEAEGTAPFGRLLTGGHPAVTPPSEEGRGRVSTYGETTRLYASGTTGMPKGVALSSLVEVLTAHDVIMHFPLSPEDKTLNMTPSRPSGSVTAGSTPATWPPGTRAST